MNQNVGQPTEQVGVDRLLQGRNNPENSNPIQEVLVLSFSWFIFGIMEDYGPICKRIFRGNKV